MRYSTAVKALAAFLGFGVLILVAGREWQATRELLVACLIMGGLLALARWRGRPRRML